jgi:serine/threonine protein kinase/tetratricopeptide (TPR) repeat protein
MNEEAIFAAALEASSSHDRAAFLDQTCRGDAALRGRIEALLHAHDHPDSFLEAPEANLLATVDEPVSERPGTVIGPYKLLEQIGEGGMGLVFVAEQQQPVRRRVALKVIKPGMDTREVLARFEVERQALALMDHPHIARVLDAGTTDSGRPYFVMELVRGIAITEYSDQSQLTPRARLALFIDVCHAVQHAHQKGVIHRDLKPSNVLVTVTDGEPVVKVIDFGVAKAIGQRLTDKTVYTRFTQMIGTPLYMSPEQAEMSNVDVDTRSDIYSLGVLLYELLTGTTPFDHERLRKATFDELRRIIREEEPPKPSTRISTLAMAATTVSAQRKSNPRRLSQFVRGELDWIVMKAMAKVRDERYPTAQALADDVRRFLDDRPIQARPPSLGDRVRRWSRRHRTLVRVGAGALLLSVAVLAVGAVLLKAKNADLANANAQEHAQRQRADANFAKAREVVDKMYSRVGKELGSHPRMERIRRDILQEALVFYEGFLEQKREDSELGSEAADAYLRMGELHRMMRQFDRAQQDCERAVQIMEESCAQEPTSFAFRKQLWGACNDLANSYREAGRYQDAEHWQRRSVAMGEEAIHDFPDNPEPPRRLAAMHGNLGMILWQGGRAKEAEREYDIAVASIQGLLARNPQESNYQYDLALILVNQGSVLESMGQIGNAERSIRAAVELLEKLPAGTMDEDEHQKRLSYGYAWLGDVRREQGQLAEAEQYYRKCIPTYEKLIDRFPASVEYGYNLAMMKNNLGLVLKFLRPAEAEAVLLEAVAIWRRYAKELPNDPAEFPKWLAFSLCNLASHYATSTDLSLRNPARALEVAKEAVQLAPKESAPWTDLGIASYRVKDPAAAVPALLKAMELAKDKDTGRYELHFLAMAYWDLGRKEEARKTLERALNDSPKDREDCAKEWFRGENVRQARAEATALIKP